jgi:hypothetical protein
VRSVSVVRTEFRGFRLRFCVIVKFICERIALGEDRPQWIWNIFFVIVIFICEISVLGEDRLHGI